MLGGSVVSTLLNFTRELLNGATYSDTRIGYTRTASSVLASFYRKEQSLPRYDFLNNIWDMLAMHVSDIVSYDNKEWKKLFPWATINYFPPHSQPYVSVKNAGPL